MEIYCVSDFTWYINACVREHDLSIIIYNWDSRVCYLCSLGSMLEEDVKDKEECEECAHFCHLGFTNFPRVFRSSVSWEGSKFIFMEGREKNSDAVTCYLF